MAIAIVQSGGAEHSGADTVTTSAVDTSGSSLLVIGVSWDQSTTADVSVSDSKGNTWTPLTKREIASFFACRIYYVNSSSPIVGAGHTFSATGSITIPELSFIAASGTDSTPFDVENGSATGGGTTALATGSITPSADGYLVFTHLFAGLGTSIGINESYTSIWNNSWVDGSWGSAGAYKILTPAAATNPVWSWTTDSNAVAAIAAFKVSSAVPTMGFFQNNLRPNAFAPGLAR